MSRVTKSYALYKIHGFGRTREHVLISTDNFHEAYLYEHARWDMIYALTLRGVSYFKKVLVWMTRQDDIDYHEYYIANDEVREAVSYLYDELFGE